MPQKYKAPDKIQELDIIDSDDLEYEAQKIVPRGGFDYISGGAGQEITMYRNTASFNNVDIYPRVLKGIEKPDLKTSILGIDISMPVIMAPCAAQGLAHVSAEKGTAQGVANAGTIMAISNYAGTPIEEISDAGQGAPQWFQLYMSKDDNFNRYIVGKAEDLGMKAIVFTVDAPIGGNREADARNNFVFPLSMPNMEQQHGHGEGQSIKTIFAEAQNRLTADDIQKVKSFTDLPVIVKGIQHPDDAEMALDKGAAAIWVSNHGGRQLDGGPASFEVLTEIADRINHRAPIIFDSGIRRGQHIFKALASGADIVAIGRPALYGLALGGWKGVYSVFDYLQQDLSMVMYLAGAQNIENIKQAELYC